eukprot:CAMPEP_0179151064 /NCGR_PEP_ID=MMETSP0796-20121207/73313_1 /TAXON_ID=73915 /ORGANISM="Pyrodinium bahamense, Strain pbaha01" /LENGTH=800 /DNA_ID=CAMNT_0020852115 /DNA_START=22 /DNA_END=2421 /DNA_ORIENTATION=+
MALRPQQRIALGPFLFTSDFDGGNMGHVERVPLPQESLGGRRVADGVQEYAITVAPDCVGTPYENSNRTWFYFGVSLAELPDVPAAPSVSFDREPQGVCHGEGCAAVVATAVVSSKLPGDAGVPPRNAILGEASVEDLEGTEDRSTSAEGGSGDEATDDELVGAGVSPVQEEAGDDRLTIRLAVCNMNNQSKLYRQGYRPWFRTLPHNPRWQRLSDAPSVDFSFSWGGEPADGGTGFVIRWQHALQRDGSTTFFAFCVPFGYDYCRELLGALERALAADPMPDAAAGLSAGAAGEHAMRCLSGAMQEDWIPRAGAGIYFHRQELGRSLEGRVVELVTVTAAGGAGSARGDAGAVDAPPPEVGLLGEPPRHFPGRPVVFFSARVHPGETPGQFALIGGLRFLLSDDPRAVALRDNFVFKLVPMLNPDGVARGHYRTNSRGANLNRFYHVAVREEHEGIWAAKQMLLSWAEQARLLLYVDFHAHASKAGCFFLANRLKGPGQAWNIGFARLCQINSPHFDFSACDFSEFSAAEEKGKDGLGKQGSGRVAIYRDCHLCHSYTLECNYNMGKSPNSVFAAAQCLPAWAECPGAGPAAQAFPFQYDCGSWGQVGEALCVSLLDLYGHNCCSRLPSSKYGSSSKVLGSSHCLKTRRVPTGADRLPQLPERLLSLEGVAEREAGCGRPGCAWGAAAYVAGPRVQGPGRLARQGAGAVGRRQCWALFRPLQRDAAAAARAAARSATARQGARASAGTVLTAGATAAAESPQGPTSRARAASAREARGDDRRAASAVRHADGRGPDATP